MNGRADRLHRSRIVPSWGWLMAVILVAGVFVAMGAPVHSQGAGQEGYIYTVQDGDNWDIVAAKTGVDVAALQAANPDSVRDTGWLLTGEELTIPFPENGESTTHVVGTGESWSSIAADYGIALSLLQAANPNAVRPGLILYRGEKLVIPPPGPVPGEAGEETVTPEETEAPADATPEPTDAETEEAVAEETPAAAETPAEAETAAETAPAETPEVTEADATPAVETEAPAEGEAEEAAVEESAEMTSTETITGTVIDAEIPAPADAEEEAGGAEALACPEAFVDYPDSILAALNAAEGDPDALAEFLATCGAEVEGGVVAADLTGDDVDDVVVVYQNPSQESTFVESDLIICRPAEDGYEIAYRARAAGEVRCSRPKTSTRTGRLMSCGSIRHAAPAPVSTRSTCAVGTAASGRTGPTARSRWPMPTSNWSTPLEEGSGQEIELTGGIYGSVGAGPQRSRTEMWASVDGAPYALADKIYSDSECLYHTVLDANRALQEAASSRTWRLPRRCMRRP